MKTIRRTWVAALLLVVSSGVALHTAGCAGGPLRRSTGDVIDDATITTKVNAAFAADPVVSALQVNVDTFKGNVQLNGFVDTPEQKARAEQIARGVNGVASVLNKLSVKTNAVR